ncbi:MAG: hypothetical protein LUE95_05365, partial [Oscillospiraceae bacterium]|nr:hypothetical protein [Oscillospiraceae bacterium]
HADYKRYKQKKTSRTGNQSGAARVLHVYQKLPGMSPAKSGKFDAFLWHNAKATILSFFQPRGGKRL